MNSTRISKLVTLTVSLFIFLLPGCGDKQANQKFGGKPHVGVYFLGADTSRLDSGEAKAFNKMVVKMTDDLINDIKKWDFDATLLKTQVGTFNYDNKGYLLRFSLTPHRMVSNLARSTMGIAAGPNIVEDHFELVDLKSKKMITWGDYTRDSELPMDGLLHRRVNNAIFKVESIINSQ